MSQTDPLRGLARVARRLPGYPAIRRALVPRLRGSAKLKAFAHRMWVTEVTSDGRGADLTAGNLLDGVGLQTLPTVLFLLNGVPEPVLAEAVDEVARLQLLSAGFRPVALLDRPDFAVARTYGYPAELVDSMADGTDRLDNASHWQRLCRAYGTSLFVDVPASGLTATQRAFLLALSHNS